MLISKERLEIKDFLSVIFNEEKVTIDESIVKRVDDSYKFLEKFSENKVIYGVNTGFGPMAQYKIDDRDRIELQFNLIRSHSSGTGKPMEPAYVKALMLARLNTLSLGKSGVNTTVINGLKDLINHDVTPLVFDHGGVGASGDLVQLAHLALVLIGEGEVFLQGRKKKNRRCF